MAAIREWFKPLLRIATHPVDELSRWQRSLRWFIELMRHCGRQLIEDRAEEMAAALTFRTIFSLVPLLVLGLVIFQVFGGLTEVKDNLEEPLYKLFGVFEVPENYGAFAAESSGDAPPPRDTAAAEVAGAEEEEDVEEEPEVTIVETQPVEQTAQQKEMLEFVQENAPPDLAVQAAQQEQQNNEQVRASIRKVLTDAVATLSNLDFGAIGLGGFVLFLYAALALAFSVEYDFNIIFKAPVGRPWHLRLPIYWSMVTLGVLLLALTFWFTGEIQERVVEVVGPLWGAVNHFFAFVTSWVLLVSLYVLVPNTRVRFKSAAIGALVGAALWEVGKVGFQIYVNRALPYATFYGTLGLLPLFLFWIYLSWLIVLFGLELTYALQMMPNRRLRNLATRQKEPDPLLDPRWLIPLVAAIGEHFEKGHPASIQVLADRLRLSTRSVSEMITLLRKAKLVHRVESDDEEDPGFALALPPEQIGLTQLLQIGRDLAMDESTVRRVPGREWLDRLARAEHAAADSATVASVIHENRNGQGGVA